MVVSSKTVSRSSRRWLLASLLFGAILVGPTTQSEAQDLDVDEGISKAIPFCGSDDTVDVSKRLLYVTTLDGKLSALDVANNGKIKWTVDTGESLLSSSIHKLDLTNNGKWVRMIPSLSGGLYKFDGDSIEAIPIRAEDLLKSSFKFSDDIVISGGLETNSYGISAKTGQILYECSLRGCQNYTHSTEPINNNEQHNPLSDDVLILKRETQTVRAIEPREGVERWNFSIGMHHLDVMKSKDCHSKTTSDDLKNLLADLEFKAVIPQGLLCAYSKKDTSRPLWTYQFDHPIVSAWRSDDTSDIKSIDFFSGADWLWNGHLGVYSPDKPGEGHISPSLYLGMYEKQPYIQESKALMQLTQHRHHTGNIITDSTDFPKIPFKPYPATIEALQLIEDHSSDVIVENEDEETTGTEAEPSTALTTLGNSLLYASEYINGNGFYFYTSNDLNKTQGAICDSEQEQEPNDLSDYDTDGALPLLIRAQSLMYWWKEIVIIITTTVVLVHFFLSNRLNEKEYIVVERPVPVPFGRECVEGVDYSKSQSSRSASDSNASDTSSYQSRFASDFDVVQILGKGGFGIVFAAKNKIDDCQYAIKRIVLPTKQESRDRVMREVKTLANCEHQNIVRYFHAWIETPPPGWQEEQDRMIRDRELFSTSIDIGESPSLVSSPPLPGEFSKLSIPSNNGVIERTKEWLNLKKNHFDLSQLKNIGRIRYLTSKTANGDKHDFDEEDDEDTSGIQFDSDVNQAIKDKFNNDDDDFSHIVFKDSTQGKIIEVNENDKNSEVVVVPINDTNNGTDVEEFSKSTDDQGKAVELYRSKPSKRPKCLDLTNRTSDLLREIPKVQSRMYLYIQMQLCQKQSLKDWLTQYPYDERKHQVVPIFEQIVDAVEYVHLKGLIHRDLKPSNVFFALDGKIKIGDFGLVTDNTDSAPDELNGTSDRTMNSEIEECQRHKHTQQVGTHLYMSPEQVAGLPYNYKVDIYSLGLILFELFVTFGTEMERITTLKSIRNNKFPSDFQRNFNDEFQLLQLMLSPNPSERPTTFGIRSRPPLSQSVENTSWHFEMPPRVRRESSRNSGSGDWKHLTPTAR